MILEALSRAMLFYPERGQSHLPSDLGLPFEELWLTAEDGVRTQAWWIPGEPGRPLLIFFHGNAGTMADRLDNASFLRQRFGLSLLMAEYRGYGESEGVPSERGLYLDASAAWAEARLRAGRRKVVVFGRSLGGAVAIDLAARHPVDGLIVESTFTSLPDMAGRTGIPFARHAVAYRFDSRAKIVRVSCPILIVHGDGDELVPHFMGEALRDAATAPVSFHSVAGGDHNGTWLAGGHLYWQAWEEFLTSLESD
jgi:fermentation-respiration switch protein FrsA (DUF1100 family)